MKTQLNNTALLKRIFFFCILDILGLSLALYLALLTRFDFFFQAQPVIKYFPIVLPYFLLVRITIFFFFGLYHLSWKYVGLKDLLNIVKSITVSSFILVIFINYFQSLRSVEFLKSVLIIDSLYSLFIIIAIRLSKRFFLESVLSIKSTEKKKALVLGAGNTGEMILRDMMKNGANYDPVGILDDDKKKIGTYHHGVKVTGRIDELPEISENLSVSSVIIAIPKLNHKKLKEIYLMAKSSNVNEVKIVPRIYDFNCPKINLKSLEEISLADLIGREVVELDLGSIKNILKDKRILITGGGGSIGSELVSQVCAFNPEMMIIYDNDETSIFELNHKLKKTFPNGTYETISIVGDIKDRQRVNEIFDKYQPEIVFHAAAYKHVPLMESNSVEAVKVNVVGTYNVAIAACERNVEKFIFISTDKVVNPKSIMGATKRMGEYVCTALGKGGRTEFVSVRFGNVLGSRGSVLPLFMEQIKSDGPLTVTHEKMERYLMTIPEAVSLVLQSAVIGKGGETLILDMGKPVKILKFAEDLIKLHGYEPYRDIDIKITGLRPGEKLYEELLTAEEGAMVTEHKKIFRAKISEQYSRNEIQNIIAEFNETIYSKDNNDEAIKSMLKKYIKWYHE